MKKVTVMVEYSDKNLSAYIEGAPIITTGKDLKEVEDNMHKAMGLYLQSCKDLDIDPAEALDTKHYGKKDTSIERINDKSPNDLTIK